MKTVLIYTLDPNVQQLWQTACATAPITLHDAEALNRLLDDSAENTLLLLHKTESIDEPMVCKLAEHGVDILLFSNHPNVAEGLRYLQCGIKGYLNTFASSTRIQQAMAAVNSGNIWLGQNIMQAIISAMTKPTSKHNGWRSLLTEREAEVIDWILKSKNNKEIATALNVTERTIKAHLQNIFQKLAVRDRLGLVIKIQNWGDYDTIQQTT